MFDFYIDISIGLTFSYLWVVFIYYTFIPDISVVAIHVYLTFSNFWTHL